MYCSRYIRTILLSKQEYKTTCNIIITKIAKYIPWATGMDSHELQHLQGFMRIYVFCWPALRDNFLAGKTKYEAQSHAVFDPDAIRVCTTGTFTDPCVVRTISSLRHVTLGTNLLLIVVWKSGGWSILCLPGVRHLSKRSNILRYPGTWRHNIHACRSAPSVLERGKDPHEPLWSHWLMRIYSCLLLVSRHKCGSLTPLLLTARDPGSWPFWCFIVQAFQQVTSVLGKLTSCWAAVVAGAARAGRNSLLCSQSHLFFRLGGSERVWCPRVID